VAGVARAIALFFAERRFVNQEIGALGRVDRGRAGARVAVITTSRPASRPRRSRLP